MNSRQCHNPIQEIADQSANVGYGVNPKDGKDKYALVSGEDAVGDDEHLEGAWVGSFREGETADGESDGGEHGRGHGEQEQDVPEDLELR